MRNRTAALVAIGLAMLASPLRAQELRLGYMNSLSGPGALPGKAQLDGFMLGLEIEGWRKDGDRLGGVPMRLFTADDKTQPTAGLEAARGFLQRDNVHIVAGIMWSNILIPVRQVVIQAGRIMMSTNAGPSLMAGSECHPLFLSTSAQNDQFAESLSQMVSAEGVKTIVAVAPNYQAGKDMITGFRRAYKGGTVMSEVLFKLGQSDFQPEIAKIRSLQPAGTFLFAPGGMGIAFMKQWEATGITDIRIFSAGTVDWLTLPAIGSAGLGSTHTIHWQSDSDSEENQRFVKAFIAKHGRHPSFFSLGAYEAPRLLAAALRARGGDFADMEKLAKALRHTPYPSVRGKVTFNVNGFAVFDWYRRDVVKGEKGVPALVTKGVVAPALKDSYWTECPEANRL